VSQNKFELIVALLIAATLADGEQDDSEIETVKGILRRLLNVEVLPGHVLSYFQRFRPERFHLQAICCALLPLDLQQRRGLLALIAEVIAADEVHDWAEDRFLRSVGEAIGAAPEEYKDLSFEVVAAAGFGPPPLPTEV